MNISEMLREKLGRLCEAYEVDAEHFVNEFIKMFKKMHLQKMTED